MKKLALILTLCFFCFANFALAADNETEQTAKEPAAAAEQKEETKDKNSNDDIKILIDKEAMNSELQQGTNNKCYLELEKNKYIVYVIDTKDDDTRRDLFKKAPAERVNHLYTNNEEIYNYLVKFIQSREESGRKYYGYRITGGIEENETAANGTVIYKFWFMKLDEDTDNGHAHSYRNRHWHRRRAPSWPLGWHRLVKLKTAYKKSASEYSGADFIFIHYPAVRLPKILLCHLRSRSSV